VGCPDTAHDDRLTTKRLRSHIRRRGARTDRCDASSHGHAMGDGRLHRGRRGCLHLRPDPSGAKPYPAVPDEVCLFHHRHCFRRIAYGRRAVSWHPSRTCRDDRDPCPSRVGTRRGHDGRWRPRGLSCRRTSRALRAHWPDTNAHRSRLPRRTPCHRRSRTHGHSAGDLSGPVIDAYVPFTSTTALRCSA
jgi:hypothetical protein